MLYVNAHYILPYYADDLYATTTTKGYGYGWQDWGDWLQQPGLVPDSDNPSLWFRLSPPDNLPPTISSFPAISHAPGTPATITVTASDPEGAAISYTWDFGDGSATQTSATNSVTHSFAASGNYTVKVRAKDTEWPVCATTVATIAPGLSTSVAGAGAPISAPVAANLGTGTAVLGFLGTVWIVMALVFVIVAGTVPRQAPRHRAAQAKEPHPRNPGPP